jgi:phosphoribosylformylglycinamidine synthase
VLSDYGKAITMKIKREGSGLYLLGARKDELGGSVYYDLHGELGANVPKPDFAADRANIYSVIDIIGKGHALSCHDISEGGLAACVSEMVLGGEADGKIGAKLTLDQIAKNLRMDKALFSETGGFVLEIPDGRLNEAAGVCGGYGAHLIRIGTTGGDALVIESAGKKLASVAIEDHKKAWTSGLPEAMK